METSSSKSARGRILVADDNKDSRDLLSRVLGTMGFDVRVASDGKTALETAREFQPHLALLDVLMPDPNGFKASVLLRKIEGLNDIIIVTATGWQKVEDDFLSKHGGANYHLLKPIDLENFKPFSISTCLSTSEQRLQHLRKHLSLQNFRYAKA